MLSRTLKMAFWVVYDHILKLILANLVWAALVLGPGMIGLLAVLSGDVGNMIVIGLPMGFLTAGITLPIASAGLAHMAKQLIDTRDGSVRDFFEGVRLYWRRAIGIGLFYVAAVSSLAVSVWFYAVKLKEAAPWLGYAISAVALWCLIFVGVMSMFVMPALVQKKGTVMATLKLSALLALDNPLFCVGLAIQFLLLTSVMVIPLISVFLAGSCGMVLASSAYEMLARKYAVAAAGADGGGRLLNRDAPLVFDDENDDYLNRGFRDFLFPWKG